MIFLNLLQWPRCVAGVVFRSQEKGNAGPTGVDKHPSRSGIHKLRAPASPRLMSADRLAEHVHDLARNATGAAAGEE
jgi:hypothetical protein